MKVCITGGGGFIGSHLTEFYLNRGEDVYILDNFSTGSLQNLDGVKDHPKLFISQGTILDPEISLELIGTCDLVIHLAAAVGVKYLLENPLQSIQTNIKGTELVLELCAKFRKKVVIASTSEVYGKHLDAPLHEDSDVVYGPSKKWRWSYAAAKLVDEFMALAFHRMQKLPVVIIRLFNTVGPRQSKDYGMVLPRFIDKAIRNIPIEVFGDGLQTRTFTYVDDVVQAISDLAGCEKAIGEVVNIGGTEEITILELAKNVKEKIGGSSEIKMVNYETVYSEDFEDMRRRVPSVAKLESLIGWRPLTRLDEILDRTISYQKSLAMIR